MEVTLWMNFIREATMRHMKEINISRENQDYFQNIFHTIENMMVVSDAKEMLTVNKAVLDFFGYQNLEAFKAEYDCICDFFLEEDDLLTPKIDGMSWIEYVLGYPEKKHKVCMSNGGKKYYFSINVNRLGNNSLENRFLVVLNDVTEMQMSIKQLQEAVSLLDNIISSVDNLIFVKDKELKYITCNKAFEEFIGKTKEELCGRKDYEFFPKEKAEYFELEDKKVIISGIIESTKNWFEYPNGEQKYLYTTTSPLRDIHGTILGLVGNSVDLTDIKKLEQELETKDEVMIAQSRSAAMGEMIGMIAHQWRQPISIIAMGVNNILADIELGLVSEEGLQTEAKVIMNQTQELSKTIDDFRNFFKPVKEIDELEISTLIGTTLDVVGKSLKNNNVTLVLELNSIKKFKTYSRELMQVLLNIINNSKEALLGNLNKDKKIVLSTQDFEEYLEITVCDNGGGVKDEISTKIFNPYFSTKDAKNGTGLGLYMSKTIIEKHLMGELTFNNTRDGVCFIIKIPYELKGKEHG